ncbi:serine/threonine protein kinase [Novipirellula artificiosorum]|uniref:serine/threonine protein kinase n=1 Tax=Novipirellula artificiosorum TaxID=2528016 RepID=UPI001E2FF0A1|nr:serine/threonine-protein kinase [Novipirellula artificiosorum]
MNSQNLVASDLLIERFLVSSFTTSHMMEPVVSSEKAKFDTEASTDALLEMALEGLARDGHCGERSRLQDRLPASNPDTQHFILIELIKLNMALAADAGVIERIEDYTEAMPNGLSVATVPLDLVMEEIQLRKDAGQACSHADYCERFPQFAELLRPLLDSAEVTGAVRTRSVPPELPIGSQIDDFLLIQKLGQGAFAHVYLARQVSMHRLVALKISRGGGDESQALAQFDHPNIVRVFDQRTELGQDLHLLYMQYHPGGTLSDVVYAARDCQDGQCDSRLLVDAVDKNLLRAAQAVPERSLVRQWIRSASWPAVVSWMGVQMAKALGEAHRHGVLHRDVKPANVLLTAECIPQLADFNVSFAGAAGRAGAAASFGGSIGYMAPEHLRAISASALDQPENVRERADLYSLAILLWELWQGERPFDCDRHAVSWSDAVQSQLLSRSKPLNAPRQSGNASERVLEKVLRKALSHSPEERFVDGDEMAGRLRLSLHPEAAALFDPAENSFSAWVAKWPPWVIASTVILLPNMAAGILNYEYNYQHVMSTEGMRDGLQRVSWFVNLTVFPFAACAVIWYSRRIVRAVDAARRGVRVDSADLGEVLELGHRAARLSGSLWLVSGIVFSLVMATLFHEFVWTQAVHFVLSSMICGGVAMIYPFFGMAWLSTRVFYPLCLSATMQDREFDQRAKQMERRCEYYLLIAAVIPLLGATLMILSETASQGFRLTVIGAALLGLLASFFAYRVIVNAWRMMATVLSRKGSSVPGEVDS